MKNFSTFSEWWSCAKSSAIHLATGVCKLIQTVIIGITSLLHATWRLLSKAVGRYPSLALGTFLVALVLTWLVTFVSMRSRAVDAEWKLGRLSYEYQTFLESHGYLNDN